MSKLHYNIDFTWYNFRRNDALSVEGWAFCDGKRGQEIKVYGADDKEQKSDVIWKSRTDLVEAFPEENVPVDSGFALEIPEISQVKETLKVVCDGEEILRLTPAKIQEVIGEATIIYKVDVLQILDTSLVVQGWCVDQRGRDEIKAIDGQGKEIPCEIYRTVREDARAKYQDYLGEKKEVGFTVKVDKDKITTNQVRIRFQSQSTHKDYVVDMKELKRESTRNGRLYNALRPGKWGQNMEVIRKEGLTNFVERVRKTVSQDNLDYTRWVKQHQPDQREIQREKNTTFPLTPKISIVIPLYNTPIKYLKKLMDSIVNQTYENWELCLADASSEAQVGAYIQKNYGRDSRVLYKKLSQNKGISDNTNEALSLATGDYIMLSDHDDIVEQGALYEIVKAINENPSLDILYSDEDKITMDGKDYFGPNFKPDFNPYMLESNNYICHIFVVRSSIMKKIGGFRREFDGAQDYDLILRCWEETTVDKICHIPKVLYHWRSHPGSTATNPESKRYAYEAGAKALDQHFSRKGICAHAELTPNLGIYRIYREKLGDPMISIIIPNKDHVDDLEKCLSSITEKTTYENYEILVVENNSTAPETFDYYAQMEEKYPKVKLLKWEQAFNYAAINNFAAREAKGEYLLFLNNDVELITDNWLEEFLGIAQQPSVGMVGAKLYFPDETIQHAGVIIGLGGVAGHIFSGISRYEPTYMGRAIMPHNLSAVTAACMMMPTKVFWQVGGFDEDFQVAFNDVDLCMKTREAGYEIVFNPYVELYHYESKSRGMEDTKDKEDRFFGEVHHFRQKWGEVLDKGDPYYNPNLSLKDGNCNLRDEMGEA